MTWLVNYLVSSGGLLCSLLVGVVWLRATSQSPAPRRWLAAVAVFYSVLGVQPLTRLMSFPLVAPFHPFSLADLPTHPGGPPRAPATRGTPGSEEAIVLLGGGVRTLHGRAQKIGLLNLGSAARVLEAARVYRLLGSPWLVCSGGPGAGRDLVPESDVMRDALLGLGIPADHIVLESASRTTHEQAMLIRPLLERLHVTSVVLVTSDIHMVRSLGTFRHAGMNPVPAVASEAIDARWSALAMLPSNRGFEFGAEVVHEYIGLVWYAVRGWM